MKKKADSKSEKKTKKTKFILKHKKSVTTLGIIIIVIILFLALTNITLNVYNYGKPAITITPPQKYISIYNNESEEIYFNISTKTNVLCQSACTYEFIDRGTGKVKASGDIINSTGIKVYGPGKGSGILVYNLEVKCSNKKSFVCPYSNDEISKKSSFVVVSYNLTQTELDKKEALRVPLVELIESLNTLNYKYDEMLSQLKSNNNSIPNKDNINSDLVDFKNELNLVNSFGLKLINKWENEDFLNMSILQIESQKKTLSFSKENFVVLQSKINNLSEYSKELIQDYNNQIILANQNIQEHEEIILSKDFSVNSSDFIFKVEATINDFSNLLKEIEIFSKKEVEFQYDYTTKQLMNLNELIANYENNVSQVKEEILSIENSKRCELFECLDNVQTTNFCEIIDTLILNESLNSYEIKENIFYLYNNSYYESQGELDKCSNIIINNCINDENTPYYINSQDEVIPLTNLNLVYLDNQNYSIEGNKLNVKDTQDLENSFKNYCEPQYNMINFTNLIVDGSFILNKINFSESIPNNYSTMFETKLASKNPQCCLNGVCTDCCKDNICLDDPKTYPVLLIHGHSFLRDRPAEPISDRFNKIEYQLLLDGYIDAGTLDYRNLQSSDKRDLSGFNKPIVVKTSYYYENYYSLGSYLQIVKSNEDIDSYAIRLSEMINSIKEMTKRPKVNLISHSMGGLVVRRYIQIFGTDSVDKVILIGAPNNGVEGRVEFFCPLLGEKLECEDMARDSILLSKLNYPNYVPEDVEIYTISGRGCKTSGKDGDGVVTFESSLLSYSQKNITIEGECTDLFRTTLHNDLVDIDKYPQVYSEIKEILLIDEE